MDKAAEKWIKVEDRLPEHNQIVLAYRFSPIKGHLYRLCEFEKTFAGKEINEFQIIADAGETSILATHWQDYSEQTAGKLSEKTLTPPKL